MDIKDIKFRKERVDEYTVRHWFDAGTQHLGPVYATKHYSYTVYDAEGKILSFGNNYLRTLKDVKEWIADYDRRENDRVAAEKAEEERQQREYQERLAREKSLMIQFKAPSKKPAPKLNQMFTAEMGRISKPDSIGEALDRAQSVRAKVCHITEVSTAEFDAAAESLYEGFKKEWLLIDPDAQNEEDAIFAGGHCSDAPELKDLSFQQVLASPQLKSIWFDTSYMLATLIVAPERQPLIVDTSGYSYARYAGKMA